MYFFTCNESKIYESFTFWNKLQKIMNFFLIFKKFLNAPVYIYMYRCLIAKMYAMGSNCSYMDLLYICNGFYQIILLKNIIIKQDEVVC